VTPSASTAATPLPIALPTPGHPLTTAGLLDGMRASRRPGGVPDALETEPIAAAVAERLWTFDGRPWATWTVGGACGPTTCSLEVGGASDGALGEDLYVFAVDPTTGSVELTDVSLGGTPAALVDDLDAAARDAWDGDLSGLALTNVAWQPPPDEGRFVLTYRSGGEEGSPGVTIILDVPAGTAEAG
jgi:hypothetical protein